MKLCKVCGLFLFSFFVIFTFEATLAFAAYRPIVFENLSGSPVEVILGRISGEETDYGDIFYSPAAPLRSGYQMAIEFDDRHRYDFIVMTIGLEEATILNCNPNSTRRLTLHRREYNGRLYLKKK